MEIPWVQRIAQPAAQCLVQAKFLSVGTPIRRQGVNARLLRIVCRRIVVMIFYNSDVEAQARKSLGIEVRKQRLRLELSQEALAVICGLHRTYIGAVERGERNISLDNIVRLARALKSSPSKLLHGTR